VDAAGRALLVFAVVLALVGGLLLLLSHLGVGRLPGDVVVHGKNVTLYVPIGLSILVSVVLTLVLNLLSRH